MSSSLSHHLTPALLPALSAWSKAGSALKQRMAVHSQALFHGWENALQFRQEVNVDQLDQAQVTSQAIVVLQQSNTELRAQEVVIVKQRARQVLTAMCTLDAHLRLFSWRVNADGTLLCTGSSSAQFADVQQVQMVRARNYVVACRTALGELYLSRWDVSNTGAIYLAGAQTSAMQQVQWAEMAALTPDLVVALLLTTAGSWQLVLWQLQGDDNIRYLHTSELPAAPLNCCALAVLPASDDWLCLATLVTEAPTTLALHSWHYQPGKGLTLLTTQRVDSPAIAAVMTPQVTGKWLNVVVQTVTGQLRLLVWELGGDDAVPLYHDTFVLGEGVSQATCQQHPHGLSLVYRTLTGEMQVQSWWQQPDGRVHLMGAGSQPAAQGVVIGCADLLEGNAPFLTGLVDSRGEVKLTTWRWV